MKRIPAVLALAVVLGCDGQTTTQQRLDRLEDMVAELQEKLRHAESEIERLDGELDDLRTVVDDLDDK